MLVFAFVEIASPLHLYREWKYMTACIHCKVKKNLGINDFKVYADLTIN